MASFQEATYYLTLITVIGIAIFATFFTLLMVYIKPKNPQQWTWTWFMASLAVVTIRLSFRVWTDDNIYVLTFLAWLSLLGAMITISASYIKVAIRTWRCKGDESCLNNLP